MRSLFTVALIALSYAVNAFEPTLDDGVVVLTDANFDEALAHYDSLLVEFYAPWCGHCKSLAPEYAKAAKTLAALNPPQYVAKLDATENKDAAARFDVKGFPTLHFFRNGVRSDYTGGRTEDTIVNWIKKKTGPPSEQITGDQLAVKKGNVKKAVVYIGPLEGDLYNIHIATAKNPTLADSFEFYHTSDAVGADYGLTGAGVVVLRNFDERVLAYPGPTKQGPLIEFIAKNAKPALGIWQEVMYDVARGKPAMMLIMPNYDRKLHLQFHDIAKKLKGLIEFVTLDLKSLEEHQETQLFLFKINMLTAKEPKLFIFQKKEDVADRYVQFTYFNPPEQMNLPQMEMFINRFKKGTLTPDVIVKKSEAQKGPIKQLDRYNYYDVVQKQGKEVLVYFYQSWKLTGEEIRKQHLSVLNHIAVENATNPDFQVALYDTPDLPEIQNNIKGYPFTVLFSEDMPEGRIYEGDYSQQHMHQYLEAFSGAFRQGRGFYGVRKIYENKDSQEDAQELIREVLESGEKKEDL